jgi:cell division protein FtsQ
MIILLAGAVFLLAFTDQGHQQKKYRRLQIDVLNPPEQAMITLEEIKNIVNKNFGEIEGTPVAWIDMIQLERTLLDHPYISSCEAYQTIECDLIIKVMVRAPLVRIINAENQQYYLDYYGYAMPVNPARPAHVLIANGFFNDRFVSLDKTEMPLNSFPDSSMIRQIFPVASYIAGDSFLKSFIDQIYIHENHEIELIPKIGSQVILFGNAEDAREKLENLKTFYLKVMSKIDWNVYKSINLKYKNQVVCTK